MSIIKFLEKAVKASDQSQAYEVHRSLLTPIKQYIQANPDSASDAATFLALKIKTKSRSQQAKTLFLLDYLFCRSSIFRVKLVNEDLSFVFDILSRETSSLQSQKYPTEFKHQLARLIELWDLRYGILFPQLKCAARYLRESVGIINGDLLADAKKLVEDARQRENERYAIIHTRRNKILKEYSGILDSIKDNMTNVSRCFDILFPGFDEEFGVGRMVHGGKADVRALCSQMILPSRPTKRSKISEHGSNATLGSSSEKQDPKDEVKKETEDEEEEVIWEDDEITRSELISNSFASRPISEMLINTGLGSENYRLEVSIARTAREVTSSENRIVVDQLIEYSKLLENHEIHRLLHLKSVLVVARGEDVKARQPTCTLTDTALNQIEEIEKALKRILNKVNSFLV